MKNTFLILSALCIMASQDALCQNSYPSSGNVKIFATDEAWAEGLCVVKASGWSGLRLTRNNPAGGNYNGNWAIGYNASTGNDFSITTNLNGGQYDGVFHISNTTRNVGIGTTAPGAKFHVISDGLTASFQSPNLGPNISHIHWPSTGDWYIRSANSSGKIIIQDSGGSVGIGTSSTGAYAKVNVVGGGVVVSSATHQADASLHISTSFGQFGRMTQISAPASSAALNLMASADASSNYSWWSWGVLTNGNWAFQPSTAFGGTTGMFIDRAGNVGIGSTSPSQKLTVNGTIYGKQVKVDLSVPGPDYVFEKSYSLPSLELVKSYIDENKHLPEIPSAKEMEANGINVGEMNMLLLKKIEELTLYMIEQNKKIDRLAADNQKHELVIEDLRSSIKNRN